MYEGALDQPMPGPFSAPPIFQEKSPGDEFCANPQTLYIHVFGTIIAFSLINNDNLYQLPLFIAWVRFSRILQFSCLKPGGFTEVVTPCKERDDPRYASENVTFFRSRWNLASLSSSNTFQFSLLWLILKVLVRKRKWRKIRKIPVRL